MDSAPKSELKPAVGHDSAKTAFLVFLPAEGADGMLGLVTGIVLVLSSEHVQEAVHDSHALVEALRWQLGEVAPRGSSFPRVPPQHLDGRGQRSARETPLAVKGRGGGRAHLAAEGSLRQRRPPADGEEGLLGAAHLRASGLQGILLEGQQVVVHGVHQQTMALGVHHHPRHRLDLADELAGWDGLEADVRQELGGVGLTRGVEVEPLHGQLGRDARIHKCVDVQPPPGRFICAHMLLYIVYTYCIYIIYIRLTSLSRLPLTVIYSLFSHWICWLIRLYILKKNKNGVVLKAADLFLDLDGNSR